MKTKLEKYLGKIEEARAPKRFEDSPQADAFIEQIGTMLLSKALGDWIREGDSVMDSNIMGKLKKLRAAYEDFYESYLDNI